MDDRDDFGRVTLVLGGVRSGKSEVAERRAAATGKSVVYVATGPVLEGDEAWNARIAAHQARRPESWSTMEVGVELAEALVKIGGVALVDSLGAWVASGPDHDDLIRLEDALIRRRARGDATLLVTDEVGLSVHPPTAVGLRFQDHLGVVNRTVAEVADEVLLVVAGRVLRLPREEA